MLLSYEIINKHLKGHSFICVTEERTELNKVEKKYNFKPRAVTSLQWNGALHI